MRAETSGPAPRPWPAAGFRNTRQTRVSSGENCRQPKPSSLFPMRLLKGAGDRTLFCRHGGQGRRLTRSSEFSVVCPGANKPPSHLPHPPHDVAASRRAVLSRARRPRTGDVTCRTSRQTRDPRTREQVWWRGRRQAGLDVRRARRAGGRRPSPGRTGTRLDADLPSPQKAGRHLPQRPGDRGPCLRPVCPSPARPPAGTAGPRPGPDGDTRAVNQL